MAIKETILELLVRLHEENGSDLHVSVGAKPSCRVFGEIKQFEEFPCLALCVAAFGMQQLLHELGAFLHESSTHLRG